jgi:hypothetical protein
VDRKNYWIVGAIIGLVVGWVLGIIVSLAVTPNDVASDIEGGTLIGLLAIGLPLFCIVGGIVKSRTSGEPETPVARKSAAEDDD